MKKTSFTFILPYDLRDEADPLLLSKIFSLFLPFANEVEKGIDLPDDYGLMWALKWNSISASPIPNSVFATVSLCTTESSPRAFDEFINPHCWSMGRGPEESKTNRVLVCVVESKQLIEITEKELDTFGLRSKSVNHIVGNIVKELSLAIKKRRSFACQ